jgi:LacI family transcriptional regulator
VFPRIEDVAERAQVSLATVDRVLHGRGGVRPSTVQRVMQAASALGYVSQAQASDVLAPKPLRISFLIPAGSNRFLRMLGDLIGYSHEQWVPFNVRCHAEFIEAFNPEALAKHLLKQGRQSDGVAFMALEHPLVREAVAELADRGVPPMSASTTAPPAAPRRT